MGNKAFLGFFRIAFIDMERGQSTGATHGFLPFRQVILSSQITGHGALCEMTCQWRPPFSAYAPLSIWLVAIDYCRRKESVECQGNLSGSQLLVFGLFEAADESQHFRRQLEEGGSSSMMLRIFIRCHY